jgi:hypothetical protein
MESVDYARINKSSKKITPLTQKRLVLIEMLSIYLNEL